MKRILILICLIIYTGMIHAQVEVSLPEIDISEPHGTIIEISVDVGMLSGLNVIAYQFDIIFDQEILIPAEPYFSVSGTISDMPGWTIMANPNLPGKLSIGAFGPTHLSDSGTLINMIFEIKTDTGSCQLDFNSFIFNNGTPEASIINGFFFNDYSIPPIMVELPHMHVSVPAEHMLEIPVTIEDLSGLEVIAYQFTVSFDHNILAAEEPYFYTSGTISGALGWTIMCNAETQGQLTIGAFGSVPLQGSGTLLNLVFSVMAEQGSCQLVFNSFLLNAGTPQVSTVNGSFSNQYSDLPPVNNFVENLSIAEGENICFDALESIYVSNFTVEAGGSVRFIAGEIIVFQEGTLIMSNAYMHAVITKDDTFCYRPDSILASEIEHKKSDFFEDTDNESHSVFKLWPNPTDGMVTVELLSINESSKKYLELYNMMGERLIHVDLSGQLHYALDLTAVPRGLYLIRLMVDREMHVEKIMKK